jgi:hypothetical protein
MESEIKSVSDCSKNEKLWFHSWLSLGRVHESVVRVIHHGGRALAICNRQKLRKTLLILQQLLAIFQLGIW